MNNNTSSSSGSSVTFKQSLRTYERLQVCNVALCSSLCLTPPQHAAAACSSSSLSRLLLLCQLRRQLIGTRLPGLAFQQHSLQGKVE